MHSLAGKYSTITVAYTRVLVPVLMNLVSFRRVLKDDNFSSWNRCYILLETHMKILKSGKFSATYPITVKHMIKKCQKQPIFKNPYESNLQLLKSLKVL